MVWEWVGPYTQAFITLFIVLDPIGNVPLFHTFTSAFDETKKRRIINSSVQIALLILVFFALGGSFILNAFGISIDDFRIAGGILLLIMSIEGLLGRSPGSWIAASPRLPTLRQWPFAGSLPTHSGGPAPDSHRLPYSPLAGHPELFLFPG